MYRKETTLKRNFQKLRKSPGVRYESVGRGFESLPSHQIKKIRTFFLWEKGSDFWFYSGS